MSAVALWWRHDLRQRRWAIIGLAVLAGLSAAVPIAALAGERRTASVVERAREAVHAPDGSIERNGPDAFGGVPEEALAEAAMLPQLAATATFDLLLMRPVGSDYFFAFEFFVISPRDTALGTKVFELEPSVGRLADPAAVDEVVIDETAATELGLGPGDALTMESWTNDSRDGWAVGEIPGLPERDGPVVDLSIVGVIPPVQGETGVGLPPTVVTTPAFHARYIGPDPDTAAIGNFPGIMMFRLADGATFEEVESAVREIDSRYSGSFAVENEREDDDIAALVGSHETALRILAAISAAAALVIVGQALSRHLRGTRTSLDVMWSLGLVREQRAAMLIASGSTVAVGGAVVAGFVAWLLSPLLPLGDLGELEPNRGLELNVAVVGVGALVTAGLIVVWSAFVGWSMTRASAVPRRRRASGVPLWSGPLGLPVTTRFGVHLAVERGPGPIPLPVRSAFVGAAAAIAALTAAIVFNSSLANLLDSPDLYGWDADMVVVVDDDPDQYRAVVARLNDDDRVVRFSSERDIAAVAGDGSPRPHLDGAAIDPAVGPPLHTMVRGREPRTIHEITLGPRLADQWGADIGDTVELIDLDGDPMEFEVVGISLLPEFSFDSYRDRFAILVEASEQLAPPSDEEVEPPRNGLLIVAEQGSAEELIAEFRADDRFVVFERTTPAPLANLAAVDQFPPALAGYLALLAAGFLLHSVILAVRERRRDLAIVKCLGMRRGAVARAVGWQATTIALFGVVVGVPSGLILGRLSFAVVTDAVSVPSEVVMTWAILGAALGAIVVANLAAAGPAIIASRTHPAALMRTE